MRDPSSARLSTRKVNRTGREYGVFTDAKEPSYALLGAELQHQVTCHQDMVMAPRSGRVSATSPAV